MIGRRERKRELTKQALINAAIELFSFNGYDETTIDDIVEAADVAKVTFYYYFKSKEEIISAIKESCAEEVLSRAETLLEEQIAVDDVLEALISDMAHWTEKNWPLLKAFAAQRFGPLAQGETCADSHKPIRFIRLLEGIIKQGQVTGKFRKGLDSQKTSHLIMLVIMQEQFSWIAEGRKKGKLSQGISESFDIILNGLKRGK